MSQSNFPGRCRVALPALVLFTLALTCGSGCGQKKELPVHPLATETRLLQSGDNWVYDLDIEFRDLKKLRSVKGTGTRSETVVKSTLEGKPILATAVSVDLSFPNGNKGLNEWSEFFSQDKTTREFFYHGDTLGKDGALRILAKPSLDTFGAWATGKSLATDKSYSNDDTSQTSSAVVGTEEVETPFARFTCWKLAVQGKSKQLGKIQVYKGTVWFAPQIGNSVKISVFSSFDDEETRAGTLLLRSTNVAAARKE